MAGPYEDPTTMLLPEQMPEPFAESFVEYSDLSLDKSSYSALDPVTDHLSQNQHSTYQGLFCQQQSWRSLEYPFDNTAADHDPLLDTSCFITSPFPLSFLRGSSTGGSMSSQSLLAVPRTVNENHTAGGCFEHASSSSNHSPCATVVTWDEVYSVPTAPGCGDMDAGGAPGQQSYVQTFSRQQTATSPGPINHKRESNISKNTSLQEWHSRIREADQSHTSVNRGPRSKLCLLSSYVPPTPTVLNAPIVTSRSQSASTSVEVGPRVTQSQAPSRQEALLQVPRDLEDGELQPSPPCQTHDDLVVKRYLPSSSPSEIFKSRVPSSTPVSGLVQLSETPSIHGQPSLKIGYDTIGMVSKKRSAKASVPAQQRPSKRWRSSVLPQFVPPIVLRAAPNLLKRQVGVIDTMTMACIASYSKPGENLDWTVQQDKGKGRAWQNVIKTRKQKESLLHKRGIYESGGEYPGDAGVRAYIAQVGQVQVAELVGAKETVTVTASFNDLSVDGQSGHWSEAESTPEALIRSDSAMGDAGANISITQSNVIDLTEASNHVDIIPGMQYDATVVKNRSTKLAVSKKYAPSFEDLMETELEEAGSLPRLENHNEFFQTKEDAPDRCGACSDTSYVVDDVEQSFFMIESCDSSGGNDGCQSQNGFFSVKPHLAVENETVADAVFHSQPPKTEKERLQQSVSVAGDVNTDSVLHMQELRLRLTAIRLQLAAQSSKIDLAPTHNVDDDRAFVEALKPNLKTHSDSRLETWMKWSCTRVLGLLQIAQPPDETEALFLSGKDASKRLGPGQLFNGPIFTEGQQPLPLHSLDEFFGEHYDDEAEVFVQVPSVQLKTKNWCQGKKMSEIKAHFAQPAGKYPWNLLELASHIEDGFRPAFLNQEDCRLLSKIKFPGKNSAARNGYLPGWKEVEKWVLVAEAGAMTGPHQDSHGFNTYITIQQGFIGFGWLSNPTTAERAAWIADPDHFVGGRWRYVTVKPGQTVVFPSGTVHFVFRSPTGGNTLAFGGHYLRCSQIVNWVQTVLEEQQNSGITNEDLTVSAPEYLKKVERFVRAAAQQGKEELWGGPDAIAKFLELKDKFFVKNKGRHGGAQARRQRS